MLEVCIVVESAVEVWCGTLAPGALGADASERERSARDIWAASTVEEGFPSFLGSGVKREADEVDWRGVSECAVREV